MRITLALGLALAIVQESTAYTPQAALLSWQTATLDYGTRYYYTGYPEIGGPATPTACSRLNDGVVIYSFDETFLSYFGTQGVAAVDSAMAVLNALPNFKGASPALTQYLTQGNERVNYTAQALGLIDLKSVTLQIMMEHMGLLGETHVWDLRDREAIAGKTGQYYYVVINRNYDPSSIFNPAPSSYVNGTSFGYQIFDNGTDADAIETANDTTVLPYGSSTVATSETLAVGGYFLGLDRDTVGGLRFLYNTERFDNENFDPTCYPGSGSTSTWSPVETNSTTTTGGTATTVTGGGGLYLLGGVGHIHFAKVYYNSELGTTFGTNVSIFSIPMSTNNQVEMLPVTRTNTAPDIIFTAADLEQATSPPTELAYTRTLTWIASTVPASQGGGTLPTVISPTSVIVFNSGVPAYLNTGPSTLTQDGAAQFFNWGTYAGGTNIILYPTNSSLAALVSQASSGGIPLDTFEPAGSTNPVTSPIIYQSQ